MSSRTDRVLQAEEIGARLLASAHTSSGVNCELVKAIANEGLLDSVFAPEGVTAVDLCAIRQGLARTNTAAETAFALQGLGGTPILTSGTAKVRDRWVPLMRSGEAVVGFALTEPGAGSDAAAVTTRAEKDGEGYRITGEKAYISNAPDADVYTVFASTNPDAGSRGISAFVVPADAAGLSGSAIEMVSPHPIGRLGFDGVLAPAESLLGEVNRGFRVAMQTLDLFRPSVGAFALGMAEAALREAVGHATTRNAFGRPIAEFQGVSHQLADVRTAIAASEHLVYAAAEAFDAGDRDLLTGLAAMAKLHATETAHRAVDVAIQVLGARGLEKDSLLAHLYLEVRAPRIYEGTSEIQRNIIARELFGGRI
ncbi:MAG: acyl-CoA dehydrogenase family protein [Acidimicrobiia bacterium]